MLGYVHVSRISIALHDIEVVYMLGYVHVSRISIALQDIEVVNTVIDNFHFQYNMCKHSSDCPDNRSHLKPNSRDGCPKKVRTHSR